VEQLEDRLVPAFNAVYSPAISIWTLTQVANSGAATVTVAVTGANQLQLTDGSTVTLGTAGANLAINMLPGTTELDVQLDTGLTGNLTINLASGSRNMIMTGAVNTVGGNLAITATTGDQFVELTGLTDLSVGGSVNINLGLGDDSVSSGTSTTIGGNMTLLGVNHMDSGSLTVGGNFSQNVSGESVVSDFGLLSEGPIAIGGSFTYLGNNLSDEIDFTTGGTIGKNVYLDLGTNFDPFSNQGLNMDGLVPMTIGGNLTILGGLNVAAVPNLFLSGATSTIGGNIYINFAGSSSSQADFDGTYGGNAITFIGGFGADSIDFDATTNNANGNFQLGAGADTFNLGTNTNLSFLYIDFGPGVDTFGNFSGATQPRLTLKNLP
jgi:hypothetical protein